MRNPSKGSLITAVVAGTLAGCGAGNGDSNGVVQGQDGGIRLLASTTQAACPD